jgi:hypothetical protein
VTINIRLGPIINTKANYDSNLSQEEAIMHLGRTLSLEFRINSNSSSTIKDKPKCTSTCPRQ